MKELRIGFLLGLLATVFLFSVCKKPNDGMNTSTDKKDNVLSAVVVFSIGESKILHADSTEEKANLGSTLRPGDKVLTGDKAKVDIQIGDGSVVRLAAKTTMDFNKLMLNDNGTADTQMALVSGKVFAKVQKAQKNDNFSVVTPTAIAGVRGTSFIMENGKDNKATVKVIDGSVALAPRVPALDNLPSYEIDKNAELKKLRDQLSEKEVVIEKDQSSSIQSDNKSLGKKLDDNSISTTISTVEKTNLKVVKSDATKSEEMELKTVVTVDPKLANQMVKLNEESGSKLDETKAAQNEQERRKIEEELSRRQESEKKKFTDSIIQTPKKFETKKDIVRYYERIEKIVLEDGKTEIIGAIINQEGNVMYVHTENGIKQVNQNDVKEVIYDLQNKTKL
ncbi:MAG: lipoprotein LipL45 [Leptospiraceae bacterium]|nr:lipoprotein LipL45 [Leptospiraceae bacterium]MCK6381456.1 lipoprotein LipL45 [Leptospiraceae bacterium]NUM41455.1 lipoprotein LipL45 [Leptospiraceae bacterium]